MSPVNSNEVIRVQESLAHILPEHEASSSLRDAEALHVGLWIRPHQVGERAFVGDFLYALNALDIIDGLQRRGDTRVHAENLVVDEGGNRKVIEEVCEELPDDWTAVLFLALGVEPVYLCGLPGLVVPT